MIFLRTIIAGSLLMQVQQNGNDSYDVVIAIGTARTSAAVVM